MLVAIAVQSMRGRSMSIIARACGPGAPAPMLAYSAFRVRVFFVEKDVGGAARPPGAGAPQRWVREHRAPAPTKENPPPVRTSQRGTRGDRRAVADRAAHVV